MVSRPVLASTPEVLASINGFPARALLDTGCATFLMSRDFATKHGIKTYRIKDVPISLAVEDQSSAPLSINEQTDRLDLRIGAEKFRHAFYVAPTSHFDVLLGIPFWRDAKPVLDWQNSQVVIGSSRVQLANTTTPVDIDIKMMSLREMAKDIRDTRSVDFAFLAFMASPSKKGAHGAPDWVLREYPDISAEKLPPGLPVSRSVDHQIPTIPGAEPPFRGIYRLAQPELAELKRQLDELMAGGKIRPSTSPYGAPVLFVKKKNGKLRMCIDYRALNNQTIKNRYALPRIDELLDQVYKAKYFSKLDLLSGYHQIRVAEEDVPKTAFRTRYGHYEFLVMPFGLTNAPATFQTLMNDIFRDLLDQCVVVYLDDILIFSETKEEHDRHLRLVLDRLREHKLYANWEKCSFYLPEVEYLGFIVGHGQLKPNPELVRGVAEFPRPATVKELQSFLGMANFYSKFVKDYAEIAAPLTSQAGTKRGESNNKPIVWTQALERAFVSLKEKLCSSPVLKIPDPHQSFEVTTDASESARAIGAVLSQDGHPCAFESKKLDPAELNYSVQDKETAAIVHALKKWRAFLLGKKTVVYTDHRSLVHLATQKELNSRQRRWMDFLADFDLEIRYKPGKDNHVADALSRVRLLALATGSLADGDKETIRRAYTKDPVLSSIWGDLKEGREPRQNSNQVFYCLGQDDLLYFRSEASQPWRLCVAGDEIKSQILHDHHSAPIAGHTGASATWGKVARSFYWPRLDKDVRDFVSKCHECQMTKVPRSGIQGLLQSTEIPSRPWEVISMDFVGPFPTTARGNDYILVAVDLLTKMSRFIPMRKTFTAKQVARLFIQHIFVHHGLPNSIISDRDPRFTSQFWEALTAKLGIRLRRSTANHPQTDGQSERTIQTLQQRLRPYTLDPKVAKNWDLLLPLLEYAYNDTVHSATKETPFFLNYGFHPRGASCSAACNIPAAESFVENLDRALVKAKDLLAEDKFRQMAISDRHHKQVPLLMVPGSYVLVKRKKESMTKLERLYDGPFRVLGLVGPNAVRIELPPRSKAHNVINVSRVKQYRGVPPERPGPIDDDEVEPRWEVDYLYDHRSRNGTLEFRVHWKGYPAEDDSWEPSTSIDTKSIDDYWNGLQAF